MKKALCLRIGLFGYEEDDGLYRSIALLQSRLHIDNFVVNPIRMPKLYWLFCSTLLTFAVLRKACHYVIAKCK